MPAIPGLLEKMIRELELDPALSPPERLAKLAEHVGVAQDEITHDKVSEAGSTFMREIRDLFELLPAADQARLAERSSAMSLRGKADAVKLLLSRPESAVAHEAKAGGMLGRLNISEAALTGFGGILFMTLVPVLMQWQQGKEQTAISNTQFKSSMLAQGFVTNDSGQIVGRCDPKKMFAASPSPAGGSASPQSGGSVPFVPPTPAQVAAAA